MAVLAQRASELAGRRLQPTPVAVAGALCIASSATLVGLANVAPATAAALRCAYAVPLLAVLAWLERRSGGRQPTRLGRATLAGIFFAIDLVLWHHAIATAGAGIATVLGNLQVVFVGFGAWAAFGERPPPRLIASLPVVLAGVVLISGVVGSGAYGSDPGLAVVYGVGTSIAYAIFILLLRGPGGAGGPVAGPLLAVSVVAAAASVALGPISGGVSLTPPWPAVGWLALLALSSQVVGWMMITWAWRLLPAAETSLLLLIQPVGSLALSAVVLAERPSATQLAGCAAVLAGVVWGSMRPARPAARLQPGRKQSGSGPGSADRLLNGQQDPGSADSPPGGQQDRPGCDGQDDAANTAT
ncbi:MAG TPA: DMT family transporter [Streptosporangiaceae bacterium]